MLSLNYDAALSVFASRFMYALCLKGFRYHNKNVYLDKVFVPGQLFQGTLTCWFPNWDYWVERFALTSTSVLASLA